MWHSVLAGSMYGMPSRHPLIAGLGQQETAESCIALVPQVGQFIGTRADFIPEPICKKLSLLQDKVRPICCAGTGLKTSTYVALLFFLLSFMLQGPGLGLHACRMEAFQQ